jgi:ABC-type spermidine/putrescine transport system permease subunit II
MQGFFASGQVADLVLLVLAAEAAALFLWHRRTGRGLAPLVLAGLVLPGIAFALALRAALTGAGWGWVAAALVAAFLAHAFDLTVRLKAR